MAVRGLSHEEITIALEGDISDVKWESDGEGEESWSVEYLQDDQDENQYQDINIQHSSVN